MRTVVWGFVVGVTMMSWATDALAQADAKKSYGLFQVGATTGTEKLAVGAEFAESLNRHVVIYVSGGYQDEAPAAVKFTANIMGGVKLMLSPTSAVQPYVRLGAGAMNFRPESTGTESLTKVLVAVGGGVAVPVGRHGQIDIGYTYFRPYKFPGFRPNGVFAGFGFRY